MNRCSDVQTMRPVTPTAESFSELCDVWFDEDTGDYYILDLMIPGTRSTPAGTQAARQFVPRFPETAVDGQIYYAVWTKLDRSRDGVFDTRVVSSGVADPSSTRVVGPYVLGDGGPASRVKSSRPPTNSNGPDDPFPTGGTPAAVAVQERKVA